jgi:ABC-type phosphate transport system substrate-binding protein
MLRLRLFVLALLSLGPLLTPVFAQEAAFPGFELVGSDLGVASLSSAEVRNIFRGERALWSSGQAVTVVLPSGRSSYVDSFAQRVLGMRRDAMQRYWLGLVFQGRSAPPVNLATAAEVVAYVERTPGAIAMVPMGTAPRALVVPIR